MFRRFAFWFVCVLLAVEKTTAYVGSGPHIADVNILLPPKMSNPVEYRLQGSDGCFKWSCDHHDILSVLPEYNSSSHCSTSARLKSIAPYSGRKETAVYATDVHSGVVIRCKVFIDSFSRIQIFHSSIKLDLDGLATLRVRAFDKEDNVFSSLVGLQFMWQLIPESEKSPHHLIHVPLKDSPLSDCGGFCGDLDIQIKLENSGVFSDLYVVKGIGIGHEKVSVHLLEPEFVDMDDNIVFTVAEAMSLEPPSPVFVLVGAALRYSLKVIRGNVPQVVTLPSSHHHWSVSNTTVAQVDKMGLTHALSLGETAVIVEDTRVAGHVQLSSLNVVLPDSLCLYISPWSDSGDPLEGAKAIPSIAHWYVVVGLQYLVEMKAFLPGPGSQEIYLTESDDVKLFDNHSDYWKTLSVPTELKHGRWNSRILKATTPGLGKLTAYLTYSSGHHATKEVLKVVQEVMVCEQVRFSLDRANGTPRILLPWAPAVYQEVELKATGGCAKASGDYKWFSSDMTTVSISASGVAQAKKPGKATVKVVSIFDSFNYDEVIIEVSAPSSMIMLQGFPLETVVGSHLQAAVTMKASDGAYFYRCDAFRPLINWKAGSQIFTVVNTTDMSLLLDGHKTVEHHASVDGPACSWTFVYASGSGQTVLHATLSKEYQHSDHSFLPIVLKAFMRIAAYPPLRVQQAGDGSQFGGYWFDLGQAENKMEQENLEKLFLVPGTNMDVLVIGGPDRWDEGIDFIDTVEMSDEKNGQASDSIRVHPVSGSNGSLYGVSCQKLGYYKLDFKRGNWIGDDHPLPAVAEVSLSIRCSFPSSIALLVDEPVNRHEAILTASQADRGPGKIRVTSVSVANGQTIRIAGVGISDSGEPFANSSSLCLRWELSNCGSLAYWDDSDGSQRPKSTWERFLVLRNESGLCGVRATVTGYCDAKAGSNAAQWVETSENILTDAVRLQLVSTLRVNPEFNLLFFNPDAKEILSIVGGSCFLEAVVNDSRVLEVIKPRPGLQCSQLTLYPKGLGIALVTVYDIGLTPPRAASAVVQVADADWIKIVSGEEIRLMEGRSQSVDLMAGTNGGSAFGSSQYAYMNIHVHIEDRILELVDGDGIMNPDGGCVNASSFEIMGKHLGITTLYVSIRQQSGHEIVSQPIKVEVYASPRIHPNDIFLAPGASYMATLEGGPTIGVYVQYSSMDNQIAKVHRFSGELTAISPGNTTLLATIYGNGDITICQAYGRVEVGVPSSAILNVQSEQLGVGREISVYPLFSKGNLFSFYELCKNYSWTVEDKKVMSFQMMEKSPGENLGVSSAVSREVQHLYEEEIGYIKVLYGRSAGRTDVSATFSCDFNSESYSMSKVYTASVSLSVVPDLPLALGVPITWVLPPYYTTSALLPYSIESLGQWDSHSRKGSISYTVLKNYGEKNELADKDEISIEGDKIKTTESNSIACIQAKDRSIGRIEIASCVRVAEVVQIRIRNKKFPSHVIHLAVGAKIKIPVGYYDSLGNRFHEANDIIFYHIETNYRDVIFINDIVYDSGNIHLKALRHGKALVQVSMNGRPEKSDYILISVGAHVYPQNPDLHLGGALDFNVRGYNDQLPGQWFSANESVVSIDKSSGRAEAVGTGSTQVFFECPGIKLQTMVTVMSKNMVTVDAPKEMLTNAPYPTEGYAFSVRFSHMDNKVKGDDNKEFSFDCKVDPPFVGYTKPWMDYDTGSSYCLFYPYAPRHLVHSLPRSENMKPYISVTVNASLREASHISGSASARFVEGFSMLETGMLSLTPESNKTVITIFGNTDVEMRWNKRNMKISPIHKEDSGISGHAQFEVEVIVRERFTNKIVITLPANGQRVELWVIYEPGKSTESSVEWSPITKFFATVFVMVFAVLFTLGFNYILIDDRRENRPNTVVSPATPSAAVPHTPERGGTCITQEQSPQTPPPFVDYVRRTIDETPYYRREARRRINPQNTY